MLNINDTRLVRLLVERRRWLHPFVEFAQNNFACVSILEDTGAVALDCGLTGIAGTQFSAKSPDILLVALEYQGKEWVTPCLAREIAPDHYSVVPPIVLEKLGPALQLPPSYDQLFGGLYNWATRANDRKVDATLINFWQAGHIMGDRGVLSFFNTTQKTELTGQLGKNKTKVLEIKGLYTPGSKFECEINEIRNEQVTARSRFFLYDTKIKILDQTTSDFKVVTLTRLGSFIDYHKVSGTHAAATIALLNTVTSLLTNGSVMFTEQELIARFKLEGSQHFKYWVGALHLLGSEVAQFTFYDLVEDLNRSGRAYDAGLISKVLASKAVRGLPELKQLESVQRLLSQIRLDHTKAEKLISDMTGLNIYTLKEVEACKLLIDSLVAANVYREAEIKAKKVVVEKLTTSVASTETQIQDIQMKADKAVEAKLAEGSGSTAWADFFKDKGILIRDITATDTSTKLPVSIRKEPLALCRANFTLQSIEFVTTKPSRIIVDSNPDRVVVAGPLQVRVIDDGDVSLWICPASSQSVFGYKANSGGQIEVVWHPHVERIILSATGRDLAHRMQNTWMKACLGETAGHLAKAVRMEKDVKSAILIALLWLESCNTVDDHWGQRYTWFPTPDKVTWDDQKPAADVKPIDTNEAMRDLIAGAVVLAEEAVEQTVALPTIPEIHIAPDVTFPMMDEV